MTTTSCGDSSGVLRCCRMNDGAVVLGSAKHSTTLP